MKKWKFGICSKCKQQKELTYHHICPKFYFANSPKRPVCRVCHDDIENIIKKEIAKRKEKTLEIFEYIRIWEKETGEKVLNYCFLNRPIRKKVPSFRRKKNKSKKSDNKKTRGRKRK